ncbi:hypothetical protein WIV_gp089 [Wiseana iridescent virus]|uniref:Uncharacterized protein n=1 Tax=Wiseana iridescent virus TaxID=68347 RepID=G0T5B5_IRV9|nr:hypothetical protein WIV_gp089 [Wiseana iridescent virus]ADO00432.1 hypothetical protein [Wiseana iridescent virus]
MKDVRLEMPWWYLIIIVLIPVVVVLIIQQVQWCKECKMGVCRVHLKNQQHHMLNSSPPHPCWR